jgi:UDP-N-acetylglucosamine enolpyruvyl transferase
MRRLLVVVGVASSLGSAIPAHADPNIDASFVDALAKAGITFSDSKNAVNAGKTACGLMDQGKPELDVIQLVTQQNPGISTTSAAQFTAIAASAYCPQHLRRASDNGGPPPPPRDGVGVSGGQQ